MLYGLLTAVSGRGGDLVRALDELHTVSALMGAALAVAESGSPVERCLRVAAERLQGVIGALCERV